MKKITLSENGLKRMSDAIIKESYCDKVDMVKKYLDGNFMRATLEKDGDNVGVFVKMVNNLPTKKSYWKQDVLDILDKEFNNMISDKKERDGFLNQLLDDWYNNKISKYGSLSNYNF